jgi:pantoate--beta-alanine ligase
MTILCKTVTEWRAFLKLFQNRKIGFVPTMGHLHQGHLSLIEYSQQENDITVVSIFINPTQFNNPNDLSSYPKTFDSDFELLKKHNVDALFLPSYDEIYPDQYRYQVRESKLSLNMEGKYRPGHFDGVLTVVLKLLNIIQPHRLYLGEKDYQQYLLIKDMVEAFMLDIKIIHLPTVRLANGLAMSSRNSKLSEKEKEKAALFPKLLSSNLSISTIKHKLTKQGFIIDYIEEWQNRRFGGVWLNKIRLIDNIDLTQIEKI